MRTLAAWTGYRVDSMPRPCHQSQSSAGSFFARLGWTRFGSPFILGYSGG